MPQIQTLILAAGALQGLLLFALLVSDKRVNYASKLLGMLCLLIATTLVLPLIVASGDSPFAWLIGFWVFLPASYAALTYLYCRTAITGSALIPLDALHLLPLALCYLLNVDLLFYTDKALAFVTMAEPTLLRHKLTTFVFYGQVVVYALLLVTMVSRYQAKAKQTLSSYNPHIFRWLWCLITLMVVIWGLKVLFYFISPTPALNLLADALLVMLVYAVAIVQWRNPSLFYIEKLSNELSHQHEQPVAQQDASAGVLDPTTRATIFDHVQDQVKAQSLYRDNELTLATLAEQVGVNVHHLSEALNKSGGKNFNQFINEYRVAEVCEQLDHGSERQLIELALDAGFASKSSFNAVFKKLTGQSPTLYRQKYRQQSTASKKTSNVISQDA